MAVDLVGSGYRISIPHSLPIDATDENADIHVYLDDGSLYIGTIYTIRNVQHLMEKFEQSGECAAGRYMFDPTMLIIRDFRPETIQAVVENLVKTGELAKVFLKCE
jgi:hypothetical protein